MVCDLVCLVLYAGICGKSIKSTALLATYHAIVSTSFIVSQSTRKLDVTCEMINYCSPQTPQLWNIMITWLLYPKPATPSRLAVGALWKLQSHSTDTPNCQTTPTTLSCSIVRWSLKW